MSNVRELPLSEFGLETTDHAAERRGQHPATLRNLVATGKIPAVVIGSGRSARYLVRSTDVDAVPVRAKGAPVGNQFAKKPKPQKPRKTRDSKQSGKKSRIP